MTPPFGNDCPRPVRQARLGLRSALPGAVLLLGAAAGARAAPPAITGIVDAEHRFAAAVAAQGIGPGFSAFLADSAVVLTPEPRPARPIYDAMQADGTRLTWRPDVVSMASDGNFGWASGPWLNYAQGAATAGAGGHYFTVWRRTPADGWKVLFDGGVAYPVPAERRVELADGVARARATHRAGSSGEVSCEQRFFTDWQHKGRAHALHEFSARDVRLLAASVAPLDGRAGLDGDTLRDAPLVAARVARRISSDGGDIYIAYGDYEIGARSQFGKSHYWFVTAFDATDDCRLALELITPAAPSAPSSP